MTISPSNGGTEQQVSSSATQTSANIRPELFEYLPDEGGALLSDLRRLPRHVQASVMHLLRSGFGSRHVTNYILEQPNRGGIQTMDFEALLYRVEFVRRKIRLYEGSQPKIEETGQASFPTNTDENLTPSTFTIPSRRETKSRPDGVAAASQTRAG